MSMCKYHFYVTSRAFGSGWSVCERGRGNHFCVAYPTQYRAYIVARSLNRLWRVRSIFLPFYRSRFLECEADWEAAKFVSDCACSSVGAL